MSTSQILHQQITSYNVAMELQHDTRYFKKSPSCWQEMHPSQASFEHYVLYLLKNTAATHVQ
jgi:hypothetical protein